MPSVTQERGQRKRGSARPLPERSLLTAAKVLPGRHGSGRQAVMDSDSKAAGAAAQRNKRCFIITPIGASGSAERKHADWVKEYVVRPVFEPRGYEVSRADEIPDPSMITDTIFDLITTCEVCVADLSFLNVNVFYELGVRHAFQKPVIHIAAHGTSLPFDNSGHRTNFFDIGDYHSLNGLKSVLDEQLSQIESSDFKVSNPLTQARGRVALANSGDAPGQLMADMAARLAMLEVGMSELMRKSVGEELRSHGGAALANEIARLLANPASGSIDPRAVTPADVWHIHNGQSAASEAAGPGSADFGPGGRKKNRLF
jgi:hypothetical protein